jgi:hypothetical protein
MISLYLKNTYLDELYFPMKKAKKEPKFPFFHSRSFWIPSLAFGLIISILGIYLQSYPELMRWFPDQNDYLQSGIQFNELLKGKGETPPVSSLATWIPGCSLGVVFLFLEPDYLPGIFINATLGGISAGLIFWMFHRNANIKRIFIYLAGLLLLYPSFPLWCSLHLREAHVLFITAMVLLSYFHKKWVLLALSSILLFTIKVQNLLFFSMSWFLVALLHETEKKASFLFLITVFVCFFTLPSSLHFKPRSAQEIQAVKTYLEKSTSTEISKKNSHLSFKLVGYAQSFIQCFFLLFCLKKKIIGKIWEEYPILLLYAFIAGLSTHYLIANTGTLMRYQFSSLFFLICSTLIFFLNKESAKNN